MSPKKPTSSSTNAGAPARVEAFLGALHHPCAQEIAALRTIIRSVDPSIREDIKWNAPSFHTSEHFATFQLRHKQGVQIVLHLGAKARPNASVRADVEDPQSILEWRGEDRATVTFADMADVQAKENALRRVLRQWIALV